MFHDPDLSHSMSLSVRCFARQIWNAHECRLRQKLSRAAKSVKRECGTESVIGFLAPMNLGINER
jgi:hypothetical protein